MSEEEVNPQKRVIGTPFKKGRPPTKGTTGMLGITGRKAIPDDATLSEALKITLGKNGKAEIARALIGLAKGGDKVSPAVQLNAIVAIYERVEGKPRQVQVNTHEKEDPLFELLQKALADDTDTKKLPAGQPVDDFIDAEVREVDSEDVGFTLSGR